MSKAKDVLVHVVGVLRDLRQVSPYCEDDWYEYEAFEEVQKATYPTCLVCIENGSNVLYNCVPRVTPRLMRWR